jgi:predicted homoserine dehydrogenase-like protein
MNIGVIGAGRIGKVHAQNTAQFVPELTIKTLIDYDLDKAWESIKVADDAKVKLGQTG